MKKRLGREIFWLSLPVVLLGGLAFYQTRGGVLSALKFSNPFDPGPTRIEFSEFTPGKLTPLNVSHGNNWATQTTLKTVGKLNIPSNWRENGLGGGSDVMRLVYRRGKIWKQTNSRSAWRSTLEDGTTTIKVDLKAVPQDSDEVRLRGQFQDGKMYRGVIPRGWVAPKNVRHLGLNHFFTISSKPFDVLIKGPGQSWPSPQVSRHQELDVMEGKWLRDASGGNLLLRVRAKSGSDITRCYVDDLRYFDAGGKPLTVYQNAVSTVPAAPQGSMRQGVSPELPGNEEVVCLAQRNAQPRGGWSKVKMPITITGVVSDGECWPTPFKIIVAPQVGEVRNYGAP